MAEVKIAQVPAAPVALPTKQKNKGKLSRNKRKKGRAGSPISMYVRDKIDAATYFRLTGQSNKR